MEINAMRGFLGILFFGIVALVAGTLGFQAGVASSVSAGTGGVPAVVYLGGGFNFGGLLFFLFFLFFIGMLASAFGGRRRHWAGHGPMGRGPWMGGHGPMGDGDPRRQWIADAHRHLHEEEAARSAGASPGSGASAGSATGSTGPTTSGAGPVAG
jgi:hypothetical protein